MNPHASMRVTALCDEVGMRQQGTLGASGGSGGEQDRRAVVRCSVGSVRASLEREE